jgi:Tfp pilus assembly major pilin PilA
MRTLTRLLLVAALAAAGCSGRDGAGSADVARWEGEMPIAGPWVRDRLPRGTQVYQRIPHPLGLLAAPKGNLLDAALASEANVRNLMAIHEGLVATLTADSGILSDPRASLLIDHLRSPVEVAATILPIPTVLAGMTLDLRSNAEVEALFGALAQYPPLPGLAGPLDDAGYGDLVGLPIPALVNFDAATGRLAIFCGAGANRSTLEGLLGPSGENLEHPMAELESQIDASGQGLFSWVDTSELIALGGMFMPPEADTFMRATGAQQLRSAAFGMGVADGKGRLKVVADIGTLSTDRPFPQIANDISATSVGEPRSLYLLSIPDPAEFRRIEALVQSYLPPEAGAQWDGVKASVTEAIGVSIEEILEAIGPELVYFTDRAGEFVGLKVRDGDLLEDVIARLAAKSGTPVEERRVDGQTIRYVSLPGLPGFPQEIFAEQTSPWLRMLTRLKSRSYWVEEDGYLYSASLPQPLIDRARLDAETDIGQWLEESQGLDLSTSLLAATASVENLPRKTYQAYLSSMQTLADLVGAEHDIWSMPTAVDLDLPERGSLGLSINLGEPYISAEFSYESHPLEPLFGGGMGAVAGVGILAGIAIPAYQDYTMRVQVSEGLNLSAAAKAAVAETYLTRGSAPANRAAAGMTPDAFDTSSRYVQSVDVADGSVVVTYGNGAEMGLQGRTLVHQPYRSADNSVVWRCGWALPPPGLTPIGKGSTAAVTTVEPRYLPSACRP